MPVSVSDSKPIIRYSKMVFE